MQVNPELGLVAIGSQSHISLLDARAGTNPVAVSSINSMDESRGVRSLEFNRHVLAIGGGYGRISFFDVRAGKYLDLNLHTPDQQRPRSFYDVGPGWLVSSSKDFVQLSVGS